MPEEQLQGPPPREVIEPRRPEAESEARRRGQYTETSPDLSGGDPDADWQRAAHVGEEAVGGTVATPDQSNVDEIGEALGVGQAPDDEVRPSSEILDARDRDRWKDEE